MSLLVIGKYVLEDPSLGNEGLLEDTAIYIEDDKIAEIGDRLQLKAKYPTAKIIGNGQQLVMPGFIDGHSQGWGLTSFQVGSGYDFLEKWVLDLALSINIDPYLSACYSAVKHVESGCTTMHHYWNPKNTEAIEEEIAKTIKGYKDVGIRFALSLGVRDQNNYTYDDEAFIASLPEPLRSKALSMTSASKEKIMGDYFLLFDHIFKKYDDEGCRVFFGPLAPQWCSDELLMANTRKGKILWQYQNTFACFANHSPKGL
ncbi:MAG: hypothetical protein GX076_05045 [Clostridiales bacterium]|nr:hypothetical protein [Clostridiales bacterium]